MRLGVLAACALLLGGCSSAPEPQATAPAGDVSFISWGGVYQDAQDVAIIQPYIAETGMDVVQDSPSDIAKIIQQVDTGNVSWDVVDLETPQVLANCGTYAQPLDFTIIDASTIDPDLVSECGVPAITYATVLTYDNTKFTGSDVPASWSDFFDAERFPGTRALPSGANEGAIEIALLADGVKPEDLYPLDYERAFRKLDSLGDSLIFFDSGAQSQQMMESGEVAMIAAWNGRAYNAAKNGAPFTPVWNQQLKLYELYMVPVGAPHPEEAMKLINYAIGPEASGRMQSTIPYGSPNSLTPPSTGDALFQEWLDSNHYDTAVLQDQEWWMEHLKEGTTAWIGWFAG